MIDSPLVHAKILFPITLSFPSLFFPNPNWLFLTFEGVARREVFGFIEIKNILLHTLVGL